MAGTQDSERDLWLLLLGATLMSGELLNAMIAKLPEDAVPVDLKSLWRAIRLKSKDGVAAALAAKGVADNGKQAGVAVLGAVVDRHVASYCKSLVDKAELAKRAGSPGEMADLFERYAVQIRAGIAASEK